MKTSAFAIALATMFMIGAFDMTRGVMAPFMQADWSLSYLQLGTVFAANSLGYVLGSLTSGFVADRFGLKNVMMAGGFFVVVGLVAFLVLHEFTAVVGGFLVYGVGVGCLEIGVNGLIPKLAKTEHDQASYFNVLHGLYGVGAFTFPMCAVWMFTTMGSWRGVYWVLGAGLSVVIITAWLSKSRVLARGQMVNKQVDSHHSEGPAAKAAYRNPLLYFLLFAISAYVMAEGAFGTWLPTYLVNVRELSVEQGSLYLSGFYLTFTIGRLTAPLWVKKLGNYRTVVISSVVALIATSLAILNGQWLALFVLAGAGFAAVFPTIASIASHSFPDESGAVIGFLFTASGLGSMLVNEVIGWIATRYGLAIGFSVVILFLGITLFSTLCSRWFMRPRMAVEQL